MPKIALPQVSSVASVDVERETIETLVQQIEFLLAGRIDKDNLVKDGDDYSLISADTVQDMASTVRPIGGVKLIGNKASDENDFKSDIFDVMVDKMTANPQYQVITGRKVEQFINEGTKGQQFFPKAIKVKIDKADNLRVVRGAEWFNSHLDGTEGYEYSDTRNSHALNQEKPALTVNVFCTSNETGFGWHWYIDTFVEAFDSVTITFGIVYSKSTFGTDNYMAVDFEAVVLCERVL